jgi:hypothetical protein
MSDSRGLPVAVTSYSSEPDTRPIRSGREVVCLAETLYLRLFIIALGGLQFVCGLAVLAAIVRTSNAHFVRTAALAGGLALAAVLTLRSPGVGYRLMRRRPIFSLAIPVLALVALALDGVSHSPLSYPAAVSVVDLPRFRGVRLLSS